MKNLKIYKNNCKEEVLTGIQLQKKHSEYTIGKTLFAASDVGNERTHQEDSVIIIEHPKNNNIKLIAVADGVGGHSDGDIASNHVIKKVINWFENEDFSNQKTASEIRNKLNKMISSSIYDWKASSNAGTTLALALIGTKKTIIANVGDSRIYTYKDGTLIQETIDDSKVEEEYEKNIIPSRELMRFHNNSNIVTQAIKRGVPPFKINFKLINSDYDKIIAVTDGVSDCLSSEELKNIIENAKEENIAREIVKEALNHNSYLVKTIRDLPENEKKVVLNIKEIIEEDYMKIIRGGKDNTTAAVHIKNK